METTPLKNPIERVYWHSKTKIIVRFSDDLLSQNNLPIASIEPSLSILKSYKWSPRSIAVETSPCELPVQYYLTVNNKRLPILPDTLLDQFHTDKRLGYRWLDNKSLFFRFFAPRARNVQILFFRSPWEEPYESLSMRNDPHNGCWEATTQNVLAQHFYGYRIEGPDGTTLAAETIVADPYSFAVAKQLTWQRPSLSIILPREFEMRGQRLEHVYHPTDELMLYEAHIRDVSALDPHIPPAMRGKYAAIGNTRGDQILQHLQRIGINAIEWLPVADFDTHEPPYNDPIPPIKNTWNPTSRNHWGYMTAHFFAPEAYYAVRTDADQKGWIGVRGNQTYEFQRMVNQIHHQKISVFLDVVYNHVAQYGTNPLRQMDPLYSLRVDREGNPTSYSGCGNDLRTERPMIRRLIVDSLLHWHKTYGIDGFRFDLAGLIDEATLDEITDRIKGVDERITLIAEPWGGIYDKQRFAKRNWGSWNDHFRDAIRGHHPTMDRGLLFRHTTETLVRYLTGNLQNDGGPFDSPEKGVNYLACHDGYTLGDFIRIALFKDKQPASSEKPITLSEAQLPHFRLAMSILYTSQGPLMLHNGDEWGRSKYLKHKPSNNIATLFDRDSYNKDNSVNWIDWNEVEEWANQKLIDFVAGLTRIRMDHPALRVAHREQIFCIQCDSPQFYAFRIRLTTDDVIIAFNLSESTTYQIPLPNGKWHLLSDGFTTSRLGTRLRRPVLSISPLRSMILSQY